MKAVKRLLNYELKLSPQMIIYLVYYIMYLKLINNNISLKTNLSKINLDNQKIENKIKALLDQLSESNALNRPGY